jgi:hypothetical protein
VEVSAAGVRGALKPGLDISFVGVTRIAVVAHNVEAGIIGGREALKSR